MKKTFSYCAVAALAIATSFTACKKESKSNNQNEPSVVEMNAHADDQSKVADDMDAVTNDLGVALEANADFAGARVSQTTNAICGATIVADTANQQKRLTITYNTANCQASRIREGVVRITMPLGTRWKDVGATVTVTYQNLKVTRKMDNKFVIINGSHEYKNVSGGLVRNFPTTPVIHTLSSSGMSITFADGTTRNWQVARKREIVLGNNITVTITGTASANGISGVAEWGTDRFGRPFTTAIAQPIVLKQDCGFRITSGQVTHNRQNINASVTFGLDVNGNATGCPGANSYYYKVSWTGINGNSHSQLFPY